MVKMDIAKKRVAARKKRAFSVRRSVSGTASRPRLSVRRSLKHISAQIIDDIAGVTIAQVSSSSKDISATNKTEMSIAVGEAIAEKAVAKGVESVVFDRKGYNYHGRIKALAEAARNKGLKF